jgi:hypothetical protein
MRSPADRTKDRFDNAEGRFRPLRNAPFFQKLLTAAGA